MSVLLNNTSMVKGNCKDIGQLLLKGTEKDIAKGVSPWEVELTRKILASYEKVFKSGLSKFCGRQPLKNLLSPLLNTLAIYD